ncbi:MAG TPA: RNA polymerase sigma factor [Polyangiaceae bacterium]|nr:RNA polymerase sigma factor [Polyangiaceae bacterium]
MGLDPENPPILRTQWAEPTRPLVKGGAGHERLTPLVLRAQQGDPDAVNQVVAELAPGVLRALTALLGRRHPDIEDLAQDVLLAVIHALPEFRGESTLLHFAVRIAARKSVLVKRRTRSVFGWLESFWQGEHPLRQSPTPALEELRGDRQRALLRLLLSELPDAQAEALLLRVVCGHSIEEISTITQTPFNTVRSRLRLAKEALRQRIEAEPKWAELGQEKT